MLSKDTIEKILKLRAAEGFSIKTIAKSLGIDVKTVRKYLVEMPASNTSEPQSPELVRKKDELARVKVETEILKAKRDYFRERDISSEDEFERALREWEEQDTQKGIQLKYAIRFIDKFLKENESETVEWQVEEMRRLMIEGVKSTLEQGILFGTPKNLEDYILEVEYDFAGQAVCAQAQIRMEEEKQQRKAERLKQIQKAIQQRENINATIILTQTVGNIFKKL